MDVYLDWADRLGGMAPGLNGDRLALRRDPLEEVSRLQRGAVVIKGPLPFKLAQAELAAPRALPGPTQAGRAPSCSVSAAAPRRAHVLDVTPEVPARGGAKRRPALAVGGEPARLRLQAAAV